MRLLVCGSRHYEDSHSLFSILDSIHSEYGFTEVIQGGARGADRLAKSWAEDRAIVCTEFPANWEKHGKAAGPIRNKQMLDEGKPDLVVAFLAKDSRGTANMIEQAKKAGVEVKVVDI